MAVVTELLVTAFSRAWDRNFSFLKVECVFVLVWIENGNTCSFGTYHVGLYPFEALHNITQPLVNISHLLDSK